MKDALIVTVMLAFFAGFGWLFYAAWRAEKRTDEARAVLAARRGWFYQRERALHFSFHGEHEGQAWTLDYRLEGRKKNRVRVARWTLPALAAPGLSWLLLGAARAKSEGGLVAQFLGGLISLRLPGEARAAEDRQAFLQAARPALLPPALAERFSSIVAASFVPPPFDDDLQRRLLRWPLPANWRTRSRARLSRGEGGVVVQRAGRGEFLPEERVEVRLDRDGLHLLVFELPDDAASCEHMIDLGLAVAARMAAGGPSAAR